MRNVQAEIWFQFTDIKSVYMKYVLLAWNNKPNRQSTGTFRQPGNTRKEQKNLGQITETQINLCTHVATNHLPRCQSRLLWSKSDYNCPLKLHIFMKADETVDRTDTLTAEVCNTDLNLAAVMLMKHCTGLQSNNKQQRHFRQLSHVRKAARKLPCFLFLLHIPHSWKTLDYWLGVNTFGDWGLFWTRLTR